MYDTNVVRIVGTDKTHDTHVGEANEAKRKKERKTTYIFGSNLGTESTQLWPLQILGVPGFHLFFSHFRAGPE